MIMKRYFSSINKTQPKKLLLEGYRVIDASRILVASFCSLMLADMGAEVIKIEQPGVGDETRKWGPPFKGPDSTYFMSLNRNKKSLTVDLKSQQGKQIVYDLVKKSDIFLQNFTPSKAQKLQISYEDLSQQNKSLIYGSLQGFPADSAWKDKAAFDLTIQAMSGIMHCTGDPKGPPYKVGYAVTDVMAGMHLQSGIMNAILHRERTGEGQNVNTSLLEANLYCLSYVASSWLNGQKNYERMGNSHPNIAPYSVYKSKDDEYIVVGVATDYQYSKLQQILDIAEDSKFKTNRERCNNRDELNEIIQQRLQGLNKAEIVEKFNSNGIPYSDIYSIKTLFEQPHIQDMHLTDTIESQNYETKLEFPKYPIHYTRMENAPLKEPPLLGEQNQQVLKDILGYSQDKIDSLKESKVI